MEVSKEYWWLVKLKMSKYRKGWINTTAGIKKDFERLLGAPQNSKEFHDWFNEMIEEGIIELYGEIPHPSNNKWMIKGYVVNTTKCEIRINTLPCAKDIYSYHETKRTI